ncbi:MAG: hypothetical protein COV44_02065 [Deltaproteobacteria bacterium CG11_big_fil_rev_8_21_14_0_20_45_16]|nr:MAG: hypothetical protein COV44_02065 [Deltaproteobacteria bacterium CG11_big_fil_rev_8_21_14_0_20_45_16]
MLLALERIVARICRDAVLSKSLIFKGGFALFKLVGNERFTRDLDALGQGISKEKVIELVPSALNEDLNDGVWFGDIKARSLDQSGEYGALRFDCAFQIGEPPNEKTKLKKLSRLHFDIGFSDRISSEILPSQFDSLLPGEDPVSWRVYPLEFILAEKLQALVDRGQANSRAKDIYDLTVLFDRGLERGGIASAIEATFQNRKTDIPNSFFEAISAIETAQLEMAWRSVKLEASEKNFEKVWKTLLGQLKRFDG